MVQLKFTVLAFILKKVEFANLPFMTNPCPSTEESLLSESPPDSKSILKVELSQDSMLWLMDHHKRVFTP